MNHRYDYFLIWGNGLEFKSEILKIIENRSNLEIVKIVSHKPKRVRNFVKEIYSYDYAPFFHLKAKTKYLLKTPKEVLLIFVLNKNPEELWLGDGSFRHIESSTIKALKTEIRDRFNERKENRLSENHVIHASDNENQTDRLLKYLGFVGGVETFLTQNPLGIPNYINYSKIRIYEVNLSELYCSIIVSQSYATENKIVLIDKSPQYEFVEGKIDKYKKYLEKYLGNKLTHHYSTEKFSQLIDVYDRQKSFDYNIITVKKVDDKLVIVDGLHRASILKYNKVLKVKVAEVYGV